MGTATTATDKLRLHGFNNLSKHLGASLYEVHYSPDPEPFLRYVDRRFNARRLALLLEELARRVDARILNLAGQDYDPHGASAAVLVSEVREGPSPALPARGDGAPSRTALAHLDKSHIAVHTYPEGHPDNGIQTLRLDLDLGTCGERSPLRVLAPLLEWLDSDVLTLDYRIRGFTRDHRGRKLFNDQPPASITDFLSESRGAGYEIRERHLPDENLLLARMKIKHADPRRHLPAGLSAARQGRMVALVRREIDELFDGRPQPDPAPLLGENQP